LLRTTVRVAVILRCPWRLAAEQGGCVWIGERACCGSTGGGDGGGHESEDR